MKQTLLILAALVAGIALLTAIALATPLGEMAQSGLRGLGERWISESQAEAAAELNATKEEYSQDILWLDRAEAEGVTLHFYFSVDMPPQEFVTSFDADFQSELAQEICSESLVRLNLWLGAVHVYHYSATDNRTAMQYRIAHSDCQV